MPAADAIVVACRSVVFTATLMLWGAALFRIRLAPEAERHRFEVWLLASLLTALFLAFFAELARVAGSWSAVADSRIAFVFLRATSPGQAWAVQTIAALLLAAAYFRSSDRGALIASLGIMVGFSLTGHAAASSGPFGLWRQANNVVHLAAAGAWLGALPFVVRALPHLAEPQVRKMLIRYSGEGHVWVALVILTGLASTLFVFGMVPPDLTTPYQMLWGLKVAAVLVMVGLAVRNRYRLVPKLKSDRHAATQIARATRVEILLGIIAVLLVSVFGTLDPWS